MMNYFVWECEYCGDKMVQVFNYCDLPSVQEQFAKQGYVILETFIVKDGYFFFVVRRLENEQVNNGQY